MDEYLQIKNDHLIYVDKHFKTATTRDGLKPLVVMNMIYHHIENHRERPIEEKIIIATALFETDIKIIEQLEEAQKRIDQRVQRVCSLVISEPQWYFITLGWNDEVITPKQMKSMTEKVTSLKYFKETIIAHEKHRENGIHHHTHILAYMAQPLAKTKLIQYIWAIAGIKKLIRCKEGVDVIGQKSKNGAPLATYQKYIVGDKKEAKMKYVEMDRIWRIKENL